jgi:hypothetical protein
MEMMAQQPAFIAPANTTATEKLLSIKEVLRRNIVPYNYSDQTPMNIGTTITPVIIVE